MRYSAVIIVMVAVSIQSLAQVDTTRNVFRPEKKGLNSPAIKAAEPNTLPRKYLVENRVVIQPDHLPNGLRETLIDDVYRGWENTTIYQDRESGDFYYELPASDTIPRRLYRFNQDGKPIAIDKEQE